MAERRASIQSLMSIAGASILAVGFVILFANLDEAAVTVANFAGISAYEDLGSLPALGLAGLHALQAYTFDQPAFISGFLKILVSFWPLVLILAGAAVLRRTPGRQSAELRTAAGSSTAGNQ
jgi:hypothetical protein